MPPAENKLVFRSVMGWVWFGLATAIAAFLLVDMAIRGSVWDAFLVAPWLAAICWVVWVFQVVPRIEADDSAARLFNLLRVIDVPWGTVAEVQRRVHPASRRKDHRVGRILAPSAPVDRPPLGRGSRRQ